MGSAADKKRVGFGKEFGILAVLHQIQLGIVDMGAFGFMAVPVLMPGRISAGKQRHQRKYE